MPSAKFATVGSTDSEKLGLGRQRYTERREGMDWCPPPGSERNVDEKYTFDGLLAKAKKESQRRQRRGDGVVVRRESLQRQLSREGRLGKDGQIRRGRPVTSGRVRRVSVRKTKKVMYSTEDPSFASEEEDFGVEETKWDGGYEETKVSEPDSPVYRKNRFESNDQKPVRRTTSVPATRRGVDTMTDAELAQMGKDRLKQGARAERKPYSPHARRSGSLPPSTPGSGDLELKAIRIPEKRPLMPRALNKGSTDQKKAMKSQEEEDDDILAQPLPWQQHVQSTAPGVYGGASFSSTSTRKKKPSTSTYHSLEAARAANRAKAGSDSSYLTSAIESARNAWYN